MICHFRDGEGIIHDISIQSEKTVKDLKKSIEKVMINFELNKISAHAKNIDDSESKEKESLSPNAKSSFKNENDDHVIIDKDENHSKPSNEIKDENIQQNKKKNEDLLTLNKSDFNEFSLPEEKISLSVFKYRRDLFTIKHKPYTLYNDQKLSELDIKEGDLFIIAPLETVKIFFMLPINTKKYFNVIFKPQFLYIDDHLKHHNINDNNNDDENNNTNHFDNDNDIYKVHVKWNNKVGWLIGPVAIPFSANCAMTLLNALEIVFGAKKTNIKIFDSSWNEIRLLSSITPIAKNNLVFGLYIRNKAEESINFPNKNLTAWTNVFKYKYYNLPTRTKSRQLFRSQSNSKLQILIAQPIPQEIPKTKNTSIKNSFNDDSIPLAKARSGPIRESQIQLNKTPSIILSQEDTNANFSIPNINNNTSKIKKYTHFYHPVPVFFSYGNDKKVLACFNSDETISVQMQEIKKDLGINENEKIGIEFNGKMINVNLNPEELKIIEFSTLKIVLSGSCLLI